MGEWWQSVTLSEHNWVCTYEGSGYCLAAECLTNQCQSRLRGRRDRKGRKPNFSTRGYVHSRGHSISRDCILIFRVVKWFRAYLNFYSTAPFWKLKSGQHFHFDFGLVWFAVILNWQHCKISVKQVTNGISPNPIRTVVRIEIGINDDVCSSKW